MEKQFIVDISNGGLIYQIFYILAFLAAYVIIIYEGYRRKFPILTWILVIAFVRFAVVIGTKVFSFSWDEWGYMIQNHNFLQNQEKTMFGGLLLGVGAYLFARYMLRFRYSAWDTVAIALPAASAIQSIGCFFYGCCYGSVSGLPWAVKYPVMSLAHYHQFESGLLTHRDMVSLPVHPVQLYQVLGGALVIFIVIKLSNRWKASGSVLLSSIVAFSLMRFGLEFFRDPLSNKTGGEMLWIFKEVQWQYLVIAMLSSILLFWREKSFRPKVASIMMPVPALSTQLLFLVFLVFLFLQVRHWLTLPEIIAMNIALLPAVILIGFEIYKAFSSLRFRWIYVFAATLPLILMSQTLPQTGTDTTQTKKFKTQYHTIGGGYAAGKFTDVRINYTGSGCSMVSNEYYFSEDYKAGGAGYSVTKSTSDYKQTLTFGVNAFYGKYSDVRQIDPLENHLTLVGVTPYVKYESLWFGIGGGLNMGSLAYAGGDTRRETSATPIAAHFKTILFPQAYFRFGPRKYLFADIGIANQFPVSAPGFPFTFGVGTGFGVSDNFNFKIGTILSEERSFFLSAYIPIENRVVIEPLYVWMGKPESTIPADLPESQFSIAFSYRFGFKK